jgi:PAS domain S-box-containing protein/putative nucleotidyltransferase with HDIG domain
MKEEPLMKSKRRILHLEDDPLDAALIKSMLVNGGIDCDIVLVGNREDFIHALEECEFNLILLDYSLPTFDGLVVLEIVKERCPDIPVIFVTGPMGEELAIETLKDGATDYVLKERLGRLVPSIKRALRESEERTISMRFEEEKRRYEERYRNLIETAPDVIFTLSIEDGSITSLNPAFEKITGWSCSEWQGKYFAGIIHPDDLALALENFQQALRGDTPAPFELRVLSKSGEYLIGDFVGAPQIEKGKVTGVYGYVHDITEKKNHEKIIEHASEEWRETFDSMPYGIMLLDRDYNIIRTNNYISQLTAIPIKELIGRKCFEVIHDTDKPIKGCPCIKSMETLKEVCTELYEPRLNKYFLINVVPFFDKKGSAKIYIHSLIDITDSKEKEKKIIESRDAFFNMLKDLDFSFKELKEIYQGLILSFVDALDAKSPWTKGHSERVTNYAIAIAREIGVNENDLEAIRTAALLHDIGKIGTYDTVLDKPGKLTDEEFALVKMHPGRGAEILSPIRQFGPILPVIRHHHERIDGKGYPDGLKGDEIPFLARILHVADSFDAMTADRPYRPAPGKEYAVSEFNKYKGIQFDTQAVEAFLRVLSKPQEQNILQ